MLEYDSHCACPVKRHDDIIHVDCATHTYPDGVQGIHNMCFHVHEREIVAVCGGNGSGKSTLSRLLFRFYDVNQGAILIDGQDVRDVTQTSLRQAIGIVPQDDALASPKFVLAKPHIVSAIQESEFLRSPCPHVVLIAGASSGNTPACSCQVAIRHRQGGNRLDRRDCSIPSLHHESQVLAERHIRSRRFQQLVRPEEHAPIRRKDGMYLLDAVQERVELEPARRRIGGNRSRNTRPIYRRCKPNTISRVRSVDQLSRI